MERQVIVKEDQVTCNYNIIKLDFNHNAKEDLTISTQSIFIVSLRHEIAQHYAKSKIVNLYW